MARPQAKIDWSEVDEMLKIQCTGVEIAEELGIHPNTLYKACEADHKISFSEYSQQKRARGVTHARRKFYSQCWIDEGDDKAKATRQIFWLKNHAGMSDKQDLKLSGELTQTSTVEVTVFEMPSNGTYKGQRSPIPEILEAIDQSDS